jgi:hypothetical protein
MHVTAVSMKIAVMPCSSVDCTMNLKECAASNFFLPWRWKQHIFFQNTSTNLPLQKPV